MKRWKVRLLTLLASVAMLLAVSGGTAMAQELFDEFGEFGEFDDTVVCIEIDSGVLLCDGEVFVEADEFDEFGADEFF